MQQSAALLCEMRKRRMGKEMSDLTISKKEKIRACTKPPSEPKRMENMLFFSALLSTVTALIFFFSLL
jgi:hypothetical protein